MFTQLWSISVALQTLHHHSNCRNFGCAIHFWYALCVVRVVATWQVTGVGWFTALALAGVLSSIILEYGATWSYTYVTCVGNCNGAWNFSALSSTATFRRRVRLCVCSLCTFTLCIVEPTERNGHKLIFCACGVTDRWSPTPGGELSSVEGEG